MGRKQSSAGRWAATTYLLGLLAGTLSSGARDIKGIGDSHAGALPGVAYLLPRGLGKKVPALLAHGGGKVAALPEDKGTTTVVHGINPFLSPSIHLPPKSVPGVASDGSLGTGKVTSSGGKYTIPSSVGTQVGGNLFESFAQFNLLENQVADFQGPSTIADIIARITGGSASSINGEIESSIQGANLFLINPAGIMFGPHARLNLTLAFTVSTANYVSLADRGKLNSSLGGDEMLTAGAVSGFGFTSAAPAAVSFNGSQLRVPVGTGLNVIAGDVTLEAAGGDATTAGANLSAPSGGLTVFSAGSAGVVPFSLSMPGAGYGSSSISSLGVVSLDQGSTIDIDTLHGGGQLTIYGGSIALNKSSTISSVNEGASPGGDIEVTANSLDVAGGRILSETAGTGPTGDAGDVNLTVVEELTIQGGGAIATSTVTNGNAGDLSVHAGSLSILGDPARNTYIGSKSDSEGSAGDVTVSAASILIDGMGYGTSTDISAEADGDGAGGKVKVSARRLFISGDGAIDSNTNDDQNAGGISVTAGRLDFNETDSSVFGGISSDTYAGGNAGDIKVIVTGALSLEGGAEIEAGSQIPASNVAPSGNGGDVNVRAGSLEITGGSLIDADTNGTGNGGDVIVHAQSILISGSLLDDSGQSGICADSEPNGKGGASGTVTVTVAGALTITGGASISSLTYGMGQAGNVTVAAQSLLISGALPDDSASSSIIAQSGTYLDGGATGDAGFVRVTVAKALVLERSGFISSSTWGVGQGGEVNVTAGAMMLSSGASIETQSDASGMGGSAGKLTIDAESLSVLGDPAGTDISSNSFSSGNAGEVTISAGSLLVNGLGYGLSAAYISAGTEGSGAGGRLIINVANMMIRDGGEINTNTDSDKNAGDLTINAGSLTLMGGPNQTTYISSNTTGGGRAGDVMVSAGNILIDGADLNSFTGISAQALQDSTGAGGSVTIDTETLSIEGGAQLSASTFSTGEGGNVFVDAHDISLTGYSIFPSGIFAASDMTNGGGAGGVSVKCDNLALDNGAEISAYAADANAGDITINARLNMTLEDKSVISSSAGIGGGSITVTAGILLYLLDSSVAAEAGALRNDNVKANYGNGGNIMLDSEFTVLNGSLISANAAVGLGGNILLESSYYLNSGSKVTATGATSGTIIISSPELDLSGALVGLPSTPIGAESQLQETCAMALNGDFSSFLAVGQGDVEAAPDEAQETTGDGGRHREERLRHRKPERRP